MGALDGLKVVELAGLGPTPFCGMLLGDMGADVLRIDRLDGRGELEANLRERNKRSASVDLKHPEGRETVLRLVAGADVLVEGYRPGVAERLGIGPDDCLSVRPQIVYARATGWGQEGPYSQMAGHDINYIALAGALDMIGPADGAPVPPLNLVGDYGGGALYLAFGIVCAVLEAKRSGKGQVVDAAMVDGVAGLLTVFHDFRQAGALVPRRGANIVDGGAPFYATYRTRDGLYMSVGALEPQFYSLFVRGLGLDPKALPDRSERNNWPALRARFAECFLERTREEWAASFDGVDACVAPVLSLGEAAAHPHNASRGMLQPFAGKDHPAPAPRLSRTPGTLRRAPASTGAYTRDALLDWGVAPEDVARGFREGWLAEHAEGAS